MLPPTEDPERGGTGRLLVRLSNWLGDVLLARPLLHALRRALPEAEVAAIGPAALLELLRADRTIDRAEAWPAPGGGREDLARRLRAWRPTAAVVLPPSFSSALFAWHTGAPVRIGFRGEWRDALLTHAFLRPARGELHLSAEYLALGGPLGAAAGPLPALEPPPEARERAAELLSRRGLKGAPYAILGPGASYGPAKRWAAERFAALGRALAGRGLGVLVCGNGAERELCLNVAAEVGGGALALAGETDLGLQAGLCEGTAVAVCNDSGLAHLSASTGAPTVVIFGSTSSAWTAPLGPRVRIVQRAPVCAPCFRRTCRIGYRCLTAVEVGEVWRACAEAGAAT